MRLELKKIKNVQYAQNNKLCLNKSLYKQLCVLICLLFFSTCLYAYAFQYKTSITIDHIEGHGFDLKQIKITFEAQTNNISNYEIEIKSALLPDQVGQAKDIKFICNQGALSKQEISCVDGVLSFIDPLIVANSSPVTFHAKDNGDYSLSIDSVQLAGGSASLDMSMQQETWVANLIVQNVKISKMHTAHTLITDLSLVGRMQGEFMLSGFGSVIKEIKGDIEVEKLGFTNQESTSVGEGIAAKLSFKTNRVDQIWESDISSTVFGGELYFNPIFIDANESAKDIYGNIEWEINTNNIQLAPLHVEDQNAMHLKISTLFDIEKKKPVSPIELSIKHAILPQAYVTYLQPFLLDTNLADLSTNGSLSGSIEINETKIRDASFNLSTVSLIDKQKRFALYNLDGDIGWGDQYTDFDYEIGFDSADIYKLRMGASKFSFSNLGDSLKLNQIVNVPILDGSLNIESFIVNNPGKDDQNISLDLSLTPVSMTKVASAFDWPELNGDLAGYAPSVVYKHGNLDVQGALLIRAFDGTTTIHNLKAQDLFSITPKLFADIQIQNLDLGSLTETFSFGEITGKLSGSINRLQFVSWKPIQFDAWLGTPDDDKSRHIISQKAVDNLTQIGNGASNIFSKSFLRFFDSFRYDRLGIGCKLYNSTCEMHGVSSSGDGFYIVKGSGIPRIDIIGFTPEVSWPVLTARLKRVITTQEIVVQ